jgi:hypothetical protein
MTNTQMIFAILLPTLTALCGIVAVLVGIMVNSGRFNSMDARLLRLESGQSELHTDLALLKSDVALLKSDVALLKPQLGEK